LLSEAAVETPTSELQLGSNGIILAISAGAVVLIAIVCVATAFVVLVRGKANQTDASDSSTTQDAAKSSASTRNPFGLLWAAPSSTRNAGADHQANFGHNDTTFSPPTGLRWDDSADGSIVGSHLEKF
jgi:hypothetical protein